ncbi:hypothetical protein [Hyphomicrobium sp.]|jgi:hypothetical protein|uniref:hypothetical protein n=1 Tax=Hyphomicrobium sp. TaxID=82 RepID=UPI002FDC82AE
MKRTLAGLAGALSFALLASGAQAAPLGAAGSAATAGLTSEVIQVHGLHASCKRDHRGWHRSYIWGRQRCAPPNYRHHNRHHHHKRWNKKRR